MKNFKKLAVVLLAVSACSTEGLDLDKVQPSECTLAGHEMIVLGDKLDNPYTVDNVNAALASLYPTKADRKDVTATNLYVRFLPEDERDFDALAQLGVELLDHPVDYQIIKDGDYYHDPSIPEDDVTWQYAVVSKSFVFPVDIRYEILDDCYLPENDVATRADDGIDWAAVEREAFRLTGNENLLEPQTKGEETGPSGRITIVDPMANGGKPFGVAGVQVCCNTFVKFGTAYCDRDGYYSMDKSFSSKVRYRLIFKNKKGFSIGLNLLLIPASVSSLGTGEPSGIDATITAESDRKLYCRSVVNNAAYSYYERCSEDDMDIRTPPSGLRIWIFQNVNSSSAVMMKHGTVVTANLLSAFLGSYASIVTTFAPDITIGVKSGDSYAGIASVTGHELAHASHYAKVGTAYWNSYIMYILRSYVSSGDMYGDGSGSGAGQAEVGEMWAYYMQGRLYYDRYGGKAPNYGTNWWFYPQIFKYMEERGMKRSEIFAALDKDVTSRQTLQTKLEDLYPERKAMITQVFNRYGN